MKAAASRAMGPDLDDGAQPEQSGEPFDRRRDKFA